ncbi:MAG: polysaccharide biosynthesis tyrosine autokinase [Phycisphaerales bacterium]|nr:polysaccharide biosynthesis tyrosine autokinase [Phycisphaerales bacterium]
MADLKLEYQVLELMSPDQNLERMDRASPVRTDNFKPDRLLGMTPSQDFLAAKQHVQLLRVERDELAKVLRPKHPKMIDLDQKIDKQDKMITFLRDQSKEQLATERQSLQKRIEGVQQSIKDWEAKALDANRRMTEYERLKANVTRAQSLYDKLLDLLQSVDVNKSLGHESLSILEPASSPILAKISVPKKLLIAVLIGLAAGLGIIYLLERFDDRVTSVTDLVLHFDEEVVGQVPNIKLRSGEPLKLITMGDERHMLAESYKNIRSSLMFMGNGDARPRVLLVTSAVPNEGKSTVSANLAQTLAMAGSRVLLIDADLRRGHLHRILAVPPGPGLSDALNRKTSLDEVITPLESQLSFIASGTRCANPGELFLGPMTDALLKQISGRFDYIIIDSPPVLAADDATSLAPKTDGVLFVVREAYTRTGLLRPALEQLYQRHVRVLGMIVNRANSASKDYYYYKYREYYDLPEAAAK